LSEFGAGAQTIDLGYSLGFILKDVSIPYFVVNISTDQNLELLTSVTRLNKTSVQGEIQRMGFSRLHKPFAVSPVQKQAYRVVNSES
jgi:hypothetical protein